MKNENDEDRLSFFLYIVVFVALVLVTMCMIGEKVDKPQKVEIVYTQKGGNGVK